MPTPINGWNEYRVEGSLSIGIWKKVSGAWSLVTTDYVWVSQQTAGGGQQTVNWSMYGTYALGAGVTDFGVTIESQDGLGATISYLNVSYTASAASSTRSATPNGETAKVTVRP